MMAVLMLARRIHTLLRLTLIRIKLSSAKIGKEILMPRKLEPLNWNLALIKMVIEFATATPALSSVFDAWMVESS